MDRIADSRLGPRVRAVTVIVGDSSTVPATPILTGTGSTAAVLPVGSWRHPMTSPDPTTAANRHAKISALCVDRWGGGGGSPRMRTRACEPERALLG